MQPRGCKQIFRTLVETSAWALVLCAVALAQITTAKPPSTNINPPGPQRQQPAGGQRPQTVNPGIATAPQPVMRAPANGVIVGYVYWDTKSVTHTPTNDCIGLGAAVSVGTPPRDHLRSSNSRFSALYHNFTYLGNVGSLAVCQYSIPQVPTGQDLQVMVNFKAVFTPQVLASVPTTANNPSGPIKISGGTCNKVPPAVPNVSVLGAGWWTCGNNAYNVNFVLQPATAGNMTSGGGQMTLLQGSQGGTNSRLNSTNPGLLSGSSQSTGMLVSGNTQSAQQSEKSGALLGNTQLTPNQGGRMQSPGSNVALNPPLTNTAQGTAGPLALRNTKAAVKLGLRVRNPNVSANGLPVNVYNVLQQQQRLYVQLHPVAPLGPASVQSVNTNQPTAHNSSPLSVSVVKNSAVNVNPISSGSSKFGAMPAGMHTKVCMPGQPGVSSVNNLATGATFSPDSQFNAYVIQGCNFGSTPGAVHLFGTFNDSSQMFFSVDAGGWTDGALYVHLNPSITGELDNNNATLVIQRSDGVTAHISGFKFVAARDTQHPLFVNNVPQGVIAFVGGLSLNHGISLPKTAPGLDSVYVARDAQQLFATGYDTYDFTKMLPGFVIWDVQPGYMDNITQYLQSPPPHWSKWSYARFGTWNTQFDLKGIRVDYEVDYLDWQLFAGTQGWNDYMSEYHLAVRVMGPRGVNNPWPSNLH